MNAILAMALKDLRLLTRDRVGLFFIIGFPFVYALFIGSIFSTGSSGRGSFHVAIADEDNTDASRDFVAKLAEKGTVKVDPATRDSALEEVRLGQAAAYIIIPAGYGAARANPFAANRPALELGTDPAHTTEGAMLEGMLMTIGFSAMRDLVNNPNARANLVKGGVAAMNNSTDNPQEAADRTQQLLAALTQLDQLTKTAAGDTSQAGISAMFTPLTIEKKSVATGPRLGRGPRNSFEFSFPQGIAWAFLFCVTRFGSSLVGERMRGTLIRMQVAPLTRWQIIGGKALACIMAMTIVAILLTTFGAYVLKVQIRDVPLFALAATCSILCFTGIMALISTLGKTEEAAAGIGTAVMLVITMTGGGAVPLLAMPPWMQSMASVSPVKWAILALEGGIWRGFTPAEMIMPCAILLAIGALCFAVGVRAFRWHAA